MADTEMETLNVVTVWRNEKQYAPQKGQPYWTFVLDDGSRISCYDKDVVKSLGIDPDERRTPFDPPVEMKLEIEMRKDKAVIVGAEDYFPDKSEDEEQEEEDEKPKKKSAASKKFVAKNPSKSFQHVGDKGTEYKSKSRFGGYGKSKEEQQSIMRMSVLRTAVEFNGQQKVKTQKALEGIIEKFEKYVKTGKF